MIVCHLISFVLGFALDLLFGDPRIPFHPIILIGKLISLLEKLFYPRKRNSRVEFMAGIVLEIFVIAVTAAVVTAVLYYLYRMSDGAGILAEAILTWFALAMKSLKKESMKVWKALNEGDVDKARKAVSMIVGRDTEALGAEGITKAAVETVAENASDGVIAPLIFLALAGPVGGYIYKAVNTMDSMIGYKNDRYMYFGRAAAKTDDVLNYLPSRITALLMIAVSMFADEALDWKNAYKIWKRDRRNHASPNSAQGEAVMAGALGVQLAGDAKYFGKIVKKPTIGDALRTVEAEDIARANRLMVSASVLAELICILGILLVIMVI
ncbi:MAG: adenosylcobinamide-phosphate synthase CbiB [Lachnospiraceae bacterium]|nr:adenosylcobinamide-phosphate synthase CbiB [Lachnospiraceae bacterium]